MTLNKMPTNFFETVEQSAFAPSNLIPGVEASEDRLLQGRLFSYADTQRYRIGANHLSLPVNRPRVAVANHGQAGDMNSGDSSADVNYQPNSFNGDADRKGGVYPESPRYKASALVLSGKTQQAMIAKTLNFRQAGETYRAYTEEQKAHLIANFAGDLNQVSNPKVKLQIAAYAFAADKDYGERLSAAAKVNLDEVKSVALGLN